MLKKSLLLMTLFLALFGVARADEVTIGTGTATTNKAPIGTYYNYSITEQLYTAEEIGKSGTINSISFYYMGTAAKDLPITVYMKGVDEADLSEGGISLADADEVFSGTLSVTTTAGWVTIDLESPFVYDGTSNLLIGFIKDYLYYFSGNTWQGTSTASTMARYTENDYNAYTTSTTPGTALATRPNIMIDITPGSGPTCDKPSTFTVDNITGYTADLEWENTGAASYTLEYKKASVDTWTVETGLTTATYTLTGLESYTTYNARVKAVCGTELESGYKTLTFTTLEVCPDGFVCIGTGDETNGFIPTYTFYNYALTQQIYTAEEIGETGAIMSVSFYSTATARTRNLDIYMVYTEKSSFADNTDYITVAATDLVYGGNVTFVQNDWTTIALDSPFQYADDTQNVAVIVHDKTNSYVNSPSYLAFEATGQSLYAYNDNYGYDPSTPGTYVPGSSTSTYNFTLGNYKNKIRLVMGELSDCDMPSDLAVSNITMQTANLTWTAGGSETAWQVCINGDEANAIDVTTNAYQLTGLTGATTYTVKVRANCGSSYSYWTPEVSFNTQICDATDQCEISYEFELNSTSYTSWHNATFDIVDTETNLVIATVSYDIAPTGTVSVCNGRDIKFVYNPASPAYYNQYNVFAFYDVNGEEIFSGTGDGNSTAVTALYTYTVDCTVTTCKKPTDLAADAVYGHSAILSWTENGEATEWVVAYAPKKGDDYEDYEEVSASTNPFTLGGLESETDYSVKVRPVCEVEKWSNAIEITTGEDCVAPSVTIAEEDITANSAVVTIAGEAETYNLRYRTPRGFHYGFETAEAWTYDDLPPCTTYDGDGIQCWGFDGSTFTNFPFIGSTFAFGSQGSGSNLESHSGDIFGLMVCPIYVDDQPVPADDWFILPEITIEEDYIFSFYGREITTQYGDEIINIGIYGETEGTFAEVIAENVAVNTTTYTLFSYDLSDYVGQTIRLAINYVSEDVFGFMFDDIFVGNPADDTWDYTFNGITSPYEITGLEAQTEYEVQVQAACDSDWTSVTFTTLPLCLVPTNLAVNDITTESAIVTWESEASLFDIDVNGVLIEDVTSPYELDHLEAGTTYSVKVRAKCDATTLSAWTSPKSFRTPCYAFDLPYEYGFDDIATSDDPEIGCWEYGSFNSENSMGFFWRDQDAGDVALRFSSYTYTEDEYYQILISPELNTSEGILVSFEYSALSSNCDYESFMIGYSTTNTFSDFEWMDNVTVEYTGEWGSYSTVVPAGTRYVAILYTSQYQYYLGIDNISFSEVQQLTELTEGWNWFSTFVAVDDPEDMLLSVEESLGENGLQIKSMDDYTTYDEGEWGAMGDLEEMYNEQMYAIEVSADCMVALGGVLADPADYEIDIYPGWNWIGFPYNEVVSIEDALADFEAEDGDQIKGAEEFSTFEDGEWGAMGDLEELVPGQGYKYYSASEDVKTLIFSTGTKKSGRKVSLNLGTFTYQNIQRILMDTKYKSINPNQTK